ncbi:non-ribosomal peptide synthetase [Nocardia jinanensis]|uniref:Peptide synthetase MbtE n=1 Tax=Nocardia jinanensis TaxID=382504 RepID=A0A917RS80_9NOCA|nr:non-ribosomal peptide synthetase [Nocardia jinanensis]GGL23303.1 putative peptide synthetase MbtE [Nocardia jinanensis]
MSIIANDANHEARRADPVSPGPQTAPRRPLSPGQRRAWFLQTRDPDDSTLNIPVAYRMRGPLDTEQLCAAVESIVERQDVLRTTYGLDSDGEPYQVVRTDLPFQWQEHDLSALSEDPARRRVEVLTRRALARPFDPTAEAPLRITLIRRGPQDHLLLLVAHTIAWDDESASVFAGELTARYNGTPLPPPPVRSDADPAGEDSVGMEYWRRVLRPLPDALELPGRPVARAAGPDTAAHISVPLPPDLLGRVRGIATAYEVDDSAVLLAAFAALIHRYTATDDFLVAVPAGLRGPRESATIGYFGNTLLIRATPRPAATFAEFLGDLGQTVTGGLAHRDIGIDRVVHAVNPDRTGARDGLEQMARIGFGVRPPIAVPELDGVTTTVETFGSPVVPVPLRVTVVLDERQPRLEADHRPAQLDGPLVQQLLGHYVQLLGSAVDDPGVRLGDLDLFGEQDRARLLARSHGELVAAAPSTLVSLVEDRVAREDSATAVVAPGTGGDPDLELSYAALNIRANRLARWLAGQGIGTEDLVALRIANSVEFVVAVLAVLKAGAAYLPIDPSYPEQRIDFLDADARPRLVLGRVELATAEASAAGLPDHDLGDAERLRPLRPDNLAYVIYTSGSTGTPKGVGVSHAAIADHLLGFGAEWDMTADDRLLQSSSVSFDASLLDIFVTLSLGACLVVPKPEALRDIPYVSDLITRHGVTVLHMVPSLLSTFLMLPEVTEWRALRRVPVGGEALLGEVADRFAGVFDAELRNHYGPTEGVVSATHLTVRGPQGTRIVPVGVPNRNVYVYLFDDRLQLVPDGVIGEIYLGGAQLARGYLHRCGLTAERFVADPFLPGQRLYRTGDLARRNSAGEIEFVGRADEQVKVRGYRIESGEVQAALSAHPGVGACAVVAFQDPATGTALAAYLVPAAGELDVAEVRGYAARSLPDYMLPTAWAVIDEIPLTEHGKLDKRALPAPQRFGTARVRPPGTPTETRLAALFGEIFGCEGVGAHDSFFELGGHSLLANRLVLLIREEFGVTVDVRALFDEPTVAGLAAVIEATPVLRSGRPELDRRPRPERIPLSYNQRAVPGPGVVRLAARLDGPLDRAALTAAFGDVYARYEILRTVFAGDGAARYQVVLPESAAELLCTEMDEAGLAAALSAPVESDRASGPLVQTRLFVLGADRYALLLTADRLVADDRSLRILLTDLATAYRSRAGAGAAPRWAGPAVDYADYVLWQLAVVESAGPQLEQWRATLAGLPEVAVPDRGAVAEIRSAEFEVPVGLRRRLRAHAETVGASEYMLYQAVVAALLHALGAGTDIALGAPLSGRADNMVAEVVGPLSAGVVLRHDLSGDPTLRTVLDRARATALGIYGSRDMVIDAIATAVRPGRSAYELCRAVVDFSEYPWPAQAWLGDEVAVQVLETGADPVHRLVFAFGSTAAGALRVAVHAAAGASGPAAVELLAQQLERLLAAFVDAPDVPASEAVPVDAGLWWAADDGPAPV